jgi:hypothetical protein
LLNNQGGTFRFEVPLASPDRLVAAGSSLVCVTAVAAEHQPIERRTLLVTAHHLPNF